MIEKIVTSKTRVKLLNLYLTHIDDRYYLRELERMLDESLSPLRRQLIKLVKMGILVTEEEANLKYYRLNKNFTGIEELRRLVLGAESLRLPSPASAAAQSRNDMVDSRLRGNDKMNSGNDKTPHNDKRFKYDAMVLTVIAFFVLATAVYVVYMNTRSINTVVNLVTEKTAQVAEFASQKITEPTRPDEMVSKRWKLLPGNIPVLSSGETGGKKRSEEL